MPEGTGRSRWLQLGIAHPLPPSFGVQRAAGDAWRF